MVFPRKISEAIPNPWMPRSCDRAIVRKGRIGETERERLFPQVTRMERVRSRDYTQAKNSLERTGIYIAFPTSSTLKSIYPTKQYKIMVNDQHTKVGIAKDSLRARKLSYLGTFENEVEFIPVAVVEQEFLQFVEDRIIMELRSRFSRVGKSREWFHTSDRQKVIDIISQILSESNVEHEFLPID